MEDNLHITSDLVPASTVVGNAGGVPETHWFIARMVRNNIEKHASQHLTKLGYDNYVATQIQIRQWKNGRRSKVEHVVIPSVVFVHCTEQQRRQIVTLPFISRFMTDRAGSNEIGMHKPLATVPAWEISRLRFMLGASDVKVSFVDRFVKGQKVRVVRGPFRDFVGEILRDADGKTSRLYLNISCLGATSIEINSLDVEPVAS